MYAKLLVDSSAPLASVGLLLHLSPAWSVLTLVRPHDMFFVCWNITNMLLRDVLM